jgi:hypothetical protein
VFCEDRLFVCFPDPLSACASTRVGVQTGVLKSARRMELSRINYEHLPDPRLSLLDREDKRLGNEGECIDMALQAAEVLIHRGVAEGAREAAHLPNRRALLTRYPVLE